MSQITKGVYRFGPFRLQVGQRLLWEDKTLVKITPKALEALLLLLEKRGTPVLKEEFFQRVWSDRASTPDDGDLATAIATIRKALGDRAAEGRYIRNIANHGGYMFIAPVILESEENEDSGRRLPENNPASSMLTIFVIAALACSAAALLWFFAFPWYGIVVPVPIAFSHVGGTILCLVVLAAASRTTLGPRPRGGWALTVFIGSGILLTTLFILSLMFLMSSEGVYRLWPGQAWRNMAFSSHSEAFGVEFAVVPQKHFLDVVFGLSALPGKDYPDFACLARLSAGGEIEAYDGDQQRYRAVSPVRYHRRHVYRFRFTVDAVTHRYSVHVREGEGPEFTIAKRFAFRRPQAELGAFSNLGMRMDNTTADDPFTSVIVWEVRVYDVWGR